MFLLKILSGFGVQIYSLPNAYELYNVPFFFFVFFSGSLTIYELLLSFYLFLRHSIGINLY